MKPVDMIVHGPTRKAHHNKETQMWDLTITPPRWSGFSASTISLTDDQYARYLSWHTKGAKIQDALPDLTAAQREILVSGINQTEWDAAMKDDEE
jgi:hypothetical protein